MKNTLNNEVANYLNNKFGDEFSLAETCPDSEMFNSNLRTDVRYKCLCDVEDDLVMQLYNEYVDEREDYYM